MPFDEVGKRLLDTRPPECEKTHDKARKTEVRQLERLGD